MVESDAVPLMVPKDLTISGQGFFGCMLSHPLYKPDAEALIKVPCCQAVLSLGVCLTLTRTNVWRAVAPGGG